MNIYSKLNHKQYEVSVICLWSLFISYTIKNTYGLLHKFILVSYNFPEEFKTILYIIAGIIMPCVITILSRNRMIETFLLKINHQTIHEDIFDDLIDYKETTGMAVYLKDSNIYYLGVFSLKSEESSYISLINYAIMDKETDAVIHEPTNPTTVLISLDNVERIEFKYSHTSNVWKRLEKGNQAT